MEEIVVRRAAEPDSPEIIRIIVESFSHDFAVLTRNMEKVRRIMRNALNLDSFFVAEGNGKMLGTAASTTKYQRAFSISTRFCIRQLGLIRGGLGSLFLKQMFSQSLDISEGKGYIEFVAVDSSARRRGVASCMIEGLITQTDFPVYGLDLDADNTPAKACYEKIGFHEIPHGIEWFRKIFGFSKRIFMEYRKIPA